MSFVFSYIYLLDISTVVYEVIPYFPCSYYCFSSCPAAPITFRCQCTNILPDRMVRHKTVNPTFVRSITRYPPGAHCKNEEVM